MSNKYGKQLPPWQRAKRMKLMAAALVMIGAGGFGVWQLAKSFAATGFENGYIYIGNGEFLKPDSSQHYKTAGYLGQSTFDQPVFSYSGKQVALVDMNSAGWLISMQNSDGGGKKVIYSTTDYSIDPNSINWSRDDNWIGFTITSIANVDLKYFAVMHADGSEFHTVISSSDIDASAGWSTPPAFSGNDSSKIRYFYFDSPGTASKVCEFSLTAPNVQCNDLIDNAGILSTTRLFAYTTTVASDMVYFMGNSCQYDVEGNICERSSQNVFSVNTSSRELKQLTNYPLVPASEINPRNIGSMVVSPDGTTLLYATQIYSDTTPELNEDRVYSIKTDGSGQSLFYDNRSPKFEHVWVTGLRWQAYTSGSSLPSIPPETNPEVGATPKTIPGVLRKGQVVKPSIHLWNNSLSATTATVTYKSKINYKNVTKSVTANLAPNSSQDVQLAQFTTDYAQDGQDAAYFYFDTKFVTNGNVQTFASWSSSTLPLPPFSLSTPGTITVKKGQTVTIKGKTISRGKVSLIKKGETKAFTDANAKGVYTFQRVAKLNEKLRICATGFESVADECAQVQIKLK